MSRLLFEKTGNSIWISHLDLMRVFQRAFKRADLPLTHTQGYSPRPSVSIALPLSVGVQSKCELLDFELDGCDVPAEEIRDRLNQALVAGVRVLEVYPQGRKLRELTLLNCGVALEYDRGIPQGAIQAITGLFSRETLIVPKRTKSGMQDQDLLPMIRRIAVRQGDANTVELEALVCCQNPTLNPAQLAAAIGLYLPEYAPDFSKCWRNEIYDSQEIIFR